MSLEEVFVQDIREHPDEDGPRLVYADWLEENGQPARAEFIRVQCERARLPEGDPRRRTLEAREAELLAQHGAEWCAGLEGRTRQRVYQRGLVEEVTLDVEELLRSAAELFRRFPLRALSLRNAQGRLGALASCPLL